MADNAAAADRDREQLDAWLVEQFERLGVLSHYECVEMVQQGADWRQMKRLLDAGCPPRLALKILR